ncbi:MAG UNVERIFIED_CONTAM: hypothetical protein LOD86_16860, partial [Thermobifida fusca]
CWTVPAPCGGGEVLGEPGSPGPPRTRKGSALSPRRAVRPDVLRRRVSFLLASGTGTQQHGKGCGGRDRTAPHGLP